MMDPSKGTTMGEAQPPLHDCDLDWIKEQGGIDVFLLSGQSNMKGRATIDMSPDEDPRIIFFHSTQRNWFIARDPLHALGVPDLIDGSDNSGTGPGMSFSRSMRKKSSDRIIGLVPSAVGGAPIDSFAPQGPNFLRSLELVKEAMEFAPEVARLRGILWLQGESDAVEENYQSFEKKLHDLVDRYRIALADPNLPFIACTIGSFVNKGKFLFASEINKILLDLPSQREHTACIDARDLKEGHIGDGMHYDADSQSEIGRRYADAYFELEGK